MNRKNMIFISLMLLVIACVVVFYILDHRIPMSDDDFGNTPGNLQNSGLFFEMDGKVFFSNASDNNCLYSMNPDESNPKRLTSMGAKYINGANGFLYFYMDSTKRSSNVTGLGAATNQYGIYRCKTNGRDQVCLHRDFCGELQLCGKYLYYQIKTDGGSLNKIRVDKKEQSKVSSEYISPVCYDDGIIYYSGVTNDHNIHALYTKEGDTTSDLINGYYFFPVVQDGYIYYLNGESNYSLWRTDLYSGSQQLVTSDRVDCFTLDSQHIYYSYSNADNPSLKRCNLDGSDPIVIYNGITNSINVTSQYIYFKVFGVDDYYYHIPIGLNAPASIFMPIGK